MNKQQLIDQIAEKAGLSKADAGRALNAFIDVTTEELSQSGEVAILGFGTFGVTARPERTGRNPKTGDPITIKARMAPRWKPGKAIKDAVQVDSAA